MQVNRKSVTDTELGDDTVGSDEKLPHIKNIEGILNSLPLLRLDKGRQAMLEYFENTWRLSEMLFSCLKTREAFFVRPYHKTRHPLIFYYVHPVCFYVNKLLVSGLISSQVNQELELLFETGVDEMKWDDLHEGDQDVWPELEEVIEYRKQVYDLVHGLIETHPCFDEPINKQSQAWAMVMAFEHERIHLETSSVLIRELSAEMVQVPAGWPASIGEKTGTAHRPEAGIDYPALNPMIDVADCSVNLGKPGDWPSFGWDNEYGAEERQVSSFKASKFLISNGEFFEFVTAGGYETEKYWSRSGWGWRQFRNIKWPTFWVQDGPAGSHRYKLRSTFSEIDMQWDWPAIVNYYEAKAYCNWLSEKTGEQTPFRLLQEGEHLVIRGPESRLDSSWSSGNHDLVSVDAVMNEQGIQQANLNLRFGSECPVNAMPVNSQGFHDAMGNVWQWCEDAFHPLTDFEIHPYYTDFSTPCFDGEHQMILGGSFMSTGDEASIWARFHFRPHFFQHAGFRLVQSNEQSGQTSNKYETTEVVDQYLLFHYGSEQQNRDAAITERVGHPQVGNFVLHTAQLMNRFTQQSSSALDLGCAVGRASFELAKNFDEVVGLDFSKSFIDAANCIKEEGELAYQRKETGNHFTGLVANVADDIDRDKVKFVVGDACSLQDSISNTPGKPFDAILLANLLCRLPDPEGCLRQFVDSTTWLKERGILVIASPNTWSQQYTPSGKFLDGMNNEETIGRLANALKGFTLLHEEDYPFMIREHRRKYEYIISQITVWEKSGR